MLKNVNRYFSLSSRALNIVKATKADLSELRKRTGISFMNCKKALELFNNDIAQAESWLQKEAQKEGWVTVGKLKDRSASQGLIGVICDGQRATFLEVNCETDFVVGSDKFQQLVSSLASQSHQKFSLTLENLTYFNQSEINCLTMDNSMTVSDIIAKDVGVIGENIVAKRAVHKIASPGASLAFYAHIASSSISQLEECKFGKFVSLVEYRPMENSADSPVIDEPMEELPLHEAALKISQHIAGLNPTEIGEWPNLTESSSLETENIPSVTTDELKDKNDYFEIPKLHHINANPNEELVVASKTENETVCDENENFTMPNSPDETETSLLKQKFLLEESMTVAEFLVQNKIEILDFLRYEVGEDIVDSSPKS